MRHRKKTRVLKLGRTASHRTSMLRNLATSLFEHERIRTTESKAKALQPFAENLITMAKKGDLHTRRLVIRTIRRKDIVSKLFEDISKRFSDRSGGYTRIIKLGNRHGDNANLSLIELAELSEEVQKGKVKEKKTKTQGK
ncbi:MAG: 50S ribosomal protein L17 [Candidatus Glassbacteria bacterium]